MPTNKNDFDKFKDVGARRAALLTMGAACVQVAQPACPVDTGNLKRSHGYTVEGDHVDIGVTADYGGYVHNGTSTRPANPWLKKAVNKNAKRIFEAGEKAYFKKLGR